MCVCVLRTLSSSVARIMGAGRAKVVNSSATRSLGRTTGKLQTNRVQAVDSAVGPTNNSTQPSAQLSSAREDQVIALTCRNPDSSSPENMPRSMLKCDSIATLSPCPREHVAMVGELWDGCATV